MHGRGPIRARGDGRATRTLLGSASAHDHLSARGRPQGQIAHGRARFARRGRYICIHMSREAARATVVCPPLPPAPPDENTRCLHRGTRRPPTLRAATRRAALSGTTPARSLSKIDQRSPRYPRLPINPNNVARRGRLSSPSSLRLLTRTITSRRRPSRTQALRRTSTTRAESPPALRNDAGASPAPCPAPPASRSGS